MRVLLLADDCNPEWPSLPVVGYQICRALGDLVEATVATHVRNRPNLERHGLGQAAVVYIDNEYIAAPLYRLAKYLRGGDKVAWTLNVALAYPSYVAFEREVWRRFGADLRAGRFHLVHRVTPMSPTLPSPLARWSPVPFILGPLNGGLRWPAAYQAERRRERERFGIVRSAHRLLPYYRSTYARAARILAAFRHTIADLPPTARRRAVNLPEVGYAPATFHPPAQARMGERLTFLFAGRLVPLKCPAALVEAFARSPELQRHRLWIVGDGPERPTLEAIINRHGLNSIVTMLGWKSQAEVADLMRQADVFAFPSIRELGAGVVVEAMACGLACVVVDYGGPGALISDATGIKLPLSPPRELTEHLRRALEGLARDPERCRALGAAAAAEAAQRWTWSAKARQIAAIYRDVVLPHHPAMLSKFPSV